jgi:Leucine-rich repeat (LRR) protein
MDKSSGNTYQRSFYNAVKLREYGNLTTEFPPYYLEDFEDINFAESFIEVLDGIQYCKHVVTLDLSNNAFSDISELAGLERLEEIYLANNRVGYIDTLNRLKKLRIVDLSDNDITDISPLYTLENLEFVNLTGNKIPSQQLEILKNKNVLVMN